MEDYLQKVKVCDEGEDIKITINKEDYINNFLNMEGVVIHDKEKFIGSIIKGLETVIKGGDFWEDVESASDIFENDIASFE